MYVNINERKVRLTSLEKMIWPEDGLTKYELVHYYTRIAPFLLPHLKERPLVVQRFPDGINHQGFYQKNCPDGAPEWIRTYPVKHRSGKITRYVIVDSVEALTWLGNQASLELHPWLSSVGTLEYPDFAVFDLDPMKDSTFEDVKKVALMVKEVLEKKGLSCYPKTSGATGLQVYVPLNPVHDYGKVRLFVENISRVVHQIMPEKTTVERKIENRQGKVYLDYLQNGRGKTLASVYSPRPLRGAPVSAPLTWDEINRSDVYPGNFTLNNILARISDKNDLFEAVLREKQELPR